MLVQNINLIHQWQGGLYNHEKNEHDNMFGYCGVTDDKIHFGVPVSKKRNMFSLRGGGGGGPWPRPGVFASEKFLGWGIKKTRKINI